MFYVYVLFSEIDRMLYVGYTAETAVISNLGEAKLSFSEKSWIK